MSGSQIFVIYTSSSGDNVTISPRLGSGHSMPQFNSDADITILDGTGVSGDTMTANFKCSSCASWSGGDMDFSSDSGGFIYAAVSGSSLDTDDTSASISQHSSMYGQFTLDFSSAKGGDSANPFSESSSDSGSDSTGTSGGSSPTSCVPRPRSSSTSGSSSSSSNNSDDSDDDSDDSPSPPWATGNPPWGDGDNPWHKRQSDDEDVNYCDEDDSSFGGQNGSGDSALSAAGAFGMNLDMLIAHGVMASMAFVIFFPAGAISIRLCSFPGLVWFHAALQGLAYMIYVVGFGLGVYMASNMRMLDHYHPRIGIALFVLLFVQPILGFLHHALFKKYQRRTFWSHAHLWLGRIIITLGIINGGLGLMWADNTESGKIAYAVVGAIVWFVYVCAAVIGEVKRARSRKDSPPKYSPRVSSTEGSPAARRSAPREYYAKPEGRAAALCQIFDSIFLDVPMQRVKFNVNTEYGYIQNFKVLQNIFNKHGIDRPVPVEALIKCKMQDNLEFLQWSKRFWDQHFPGGDYDALARRKASGQAPAGGGGAPRATTSSAARRAAGSAAGGAAPRTRTPQGGGGVASAALVNENNMLKETVAGLERERDFYFNKLRDIELLIQQAVEAEPELEKDDGLLKQIQTILYSTEEGFEIPAEAEGDLEEETF
ncbi:hypothetical protein BDY21DRAFT_386790 [Lineolata rhizophorae]|uniref:EB1 C-terminal domain-containing protein n=1 Tax=Lineolata rhizophorae TaxID=578093 RepID=A0A6A6NVX4_9PEZI|nr:hypothetical protein BDY21DRAFT_386790 [Lineolata rhizophorae]